MLDHKLLGRWIDWLETIKLELYWILVDRCVYRKMVEIVRNNPKTHDPNDFVTWCQRNYAASASIRVRQQLDTDRRAISLKRLLQALEGKATEITRAWYVEKCTSRRKARNDLQADLETQLVRRQFDKWSAPGLDHVDPAIVANDRREIEDKCRSVKTYVDKRVAHRDKLPNSELDLPTWDQLDTAIDTLDQTTCNYVGLLQQGWMRTLTPTWQYEWTGVFEHAWKPVQGGARSLSENGLLDGSRPNR